MAAVVVIALLVRRRSVSLLRRRGTVALLGGWCSVTLRGSWCSVSLLRRWGAIAMLLWRRSAVLLLRRRASIAIALLLWRWWVVAGALVVGRMRRGRMATLRMRVVLRGRALIVALLPAIALL